MKMLCYLIFTVYASHPCICVSGSADRPPAATQPVSLFLHLYLGPGRRYAEARLAAALGPGLPPQLRVGRGMETHSVSLSSIIPL